MLIDFMQKITGVEMSYIDDDGNIQIDVGSVPEGYFKYVECDEYDKDKIPSISSFHNKPIKKEPVKKFDGHNINEYFVKYLKSYDKELFDKIWKLNLPKIYSLDIETEINQETGYSSADKAENRIISISITDNKLNTLLFVVKNKNYEITEKDNIAIDNMLQTMLSEKYNYEFKFKIREFEKEVDMLNTFLECVNKYFHSMIGWNFLMFDWQYITNRCIKLGIDIKKASPTRTILEKRIEGKYESTTLKLPKHRLVIDYMLAFQDSLVYNNLESYSLNFISEKILGLNKISYDGNLRTLYNDNYPKFLTYAIVDTILVMLIHNKTKLIDIDFFESYMNKIAYMKVGQNNISEALIYNKLREKGVFLCETNYNSAEKQPYPGGYVKNPVKKKSRSVAGLDFSGLYPNSMITNNLSPEKFIDKLLMDKDIPGKVHKKDEARWQEYKALGFVLTPVGNVYDNNSDGLYVEIEKDLIAKRKVFKNYAADIYLNILEKIENAIDKLKEQNK